MELVHGHRLKEQNPV